MGVRVVCLWFDCANVCALACFFRIVFVSAHEALRLRMRVHCRQFVHARTNARTHIRGRKQNQLVCFKHISEAPGALWSNQRQQYSDVGETL